MTRLRIGGVDVAERVGFPIILETRTEKMLFKRDLQMYEPPRRLLPCGPPQTAAP